MRVIETNNIPKESPGTDSIIFIEPKQETLYENFVSGRFTRPQVEFRADGCLGEVIAEMGLGASTRAVWKQDAGCACACSPGFVVEDTSDLDYNVMVLYDPDSVAAQGELDEEALAEREAKFKELMSDASEK